MIVTHCSSKLVATWIVKRLDWKRISRGLISHRRLAVSCFKMASYVSIIVEICDEKMASMWRKSAKTYGLLSFILFFLSGSSSGFDVYFFLIYIVCCFTAMMTVQSHT